MALSNVRDTQYAVKEFNLPDGSSILELQQRLTSLNVDDAVAVQKEVKRCNNRCNGNDVDVSVRARALRLDGTGNEPGHTFAVKFHISDQAV